MKKNSNSCQLVNLFKGRIGIGDYWMGMLLSFTVFIILSSIFSDIDSMFSLFFIFWIFLQFSFSIRRAHDLNQSGWFVLLGLIPLLNIYILIKLGFERGDKKSNIYGKPSLNNGSVGMRLKSLFCS